MYYIVAGVLFCVAILMAFTLRWAPLEVAFFMSVNMTSQGLYLRRLTRAAVVSSPSKLFTAAATTIKSGR
jgi:hypothetical protein